LKDELFDMCDKDEDYVSSVDEQFTPGMEEGDMNAFRDSIVDVLVTTGE
jgi:hypothetical protein